MNQFLTRSVMRRLVNPGSNCKHCISCLSSPSSLSSSVAAAVEVHKPSSESVVMMSGKRLGFSGQWWRMMSSASEPPRKKSTSSSTTVRKEDEKGEKTSGASVEKMERKNDQVVVSSYWGVSRPKITREDGSVWPWNCFMVKIRLSSINANGRDVVKVEVNHGSVARSYLERDRCRGRVENE